MWLCPLCRSLPGAGEIQHLGVPHSARLHPVLQERGDSTSLQASCSTVFRTFRRESFVIWSDLQGDRRQRRGSDQHLLEGGSRGPVGNVSQVRVSVVWQEPRTVLVARSDITRTAWILGLGMLWAMFCGGLCGSGPFGFRSLLDASDQAECSRVKMAFQHMRPHSARPQV